MPKSSTKALMKVVYKPSTQSTDEFTLIVNPEEYSRWKNGETSIPLVEVVDSFQVFWSNQGAQGLLGKPSKQQLEEVFGTSRDDEVAKFVLEKGTAQKGEGIRSSDFAGTNFTIGSMVQDTRGKGLRGV